MAKQDLWETEKGQKKTNHYLVSCLNNLLRVGEQRHKLVWVLYLDGCAARLCHLFCLQPLKERKPTSNNLTEGNLKEN